MARRTWLNPPMTPEEFKDCLAAAGLTLAGLSRLLGLSERHVCRWANGQTMPSAAARFVVRYLAARARGEPDVLAK